VNVLVLCEDVIGTTMAGPGIRWWEISSQLARAHQVTLATPYEVDVEPANFSVVRSPRRPPPSYFERYDAVFTLRVLPQLAEAKRRYGFRLIVDLYDPVILENLELHSERPIDAQKLNVERLRRDLRLALETGDHFVCASEVQRDMWIGSLMTTGRLTPSVYASDPSLRELIDVVPFGVSSEPCARTGPGLRDRFGIDEGDFVLLWGGGIWNWLDPLTLIESVAEVASTHPDTRLVFMGLARPTAGVPVMSMIARAKRLADDLELTDRHVFFNQEWLPYEQRCNFLLDADVGVSTHSDHVETHFAFRTRNLDYFWAGLPVVASRGDVFADLLETSGAGIAVPANDRVALSDAIVSLRDPDLRARMSEASRSLGERYSWDRTVQPLMRMVSAETEVVRPRRSSVARATLTWYALAVLWRYSAAGRSWKGTTS
jgi:glycosyltransferase involved in cell wall biosynthesis